MNYLIFSIDNQQFAIDLSQVERVIWAVAVTPVDGFSSNVLGVINVQSEIIPTVNLRKTFNIRDKEIDLSDQFIICQLEQSKMALWVDRVIEIADYNAEQCTSTEGLPLEDSNISSIIKKQDRLILVYNWGEFVDHVKPFKELQVKV